MSTLPSETTPKTDQLDPSQEPKQEDKKRWKMFRTYADTCKQYRRKLTTGWTSNVDYRRAKPFASESDEDRIAVPLDWSLTNAKIALLFSQVPEIRLSHPPESTANEAMPWVYRFQSRVNDTLRVAGIEAAMNEVLPDCINAAGIGVVIVSREILTETVDVPAIDLSILPPQLQNQIVESRVLPSGEPLPMTQATKVKDSRYVISRISPSDFLWPINFSGSDFDNAPWIGRSGSIPWSEAVTRFGLTEDQKKTVVGDEKMFMDRIVHDTEREKSLEDQMVGFDEIFYKEISFDPNAESYSAIHHLVFVNGLDKPVIDEPWKGQQVDKETGQLIGALRYPVRVLTLTYITDEPIPPSYSSVGRPQVNELNKSRTQVVQQRERAQSIITFDVNRVDPVVQHTLMRGTWRGMIPVQGQGSNVISEISPANYPSENFEFDKSIKADLLDVWRIGPPPNSDYPSEGDGTSLGMSGIQIAAGMDRAKVAKFFCTIAEVIGGLICLYEDPSTIGEGFRPMVSRTLSYSILADSTLLVDSGQRLKNLVQFLNFTAKSGRINLEPVLREIATLSGLDPATVVIPAEPRVPDEPNISLRLTGTEDMLNPLTLAFLMKSGQAPDPAMVEDAKKLIAVAVTPPMGMQAPPPDPMTGQLEQAPDASTMPPSPGPAPVAIGDANPQLSAMSRINSRVVDRATQEE